MSFQGNDVNTTVQPVEDMVKETWVCQASARRPQLGLMLFQFAEAIKDEPDFFLLAGHMPVSKDNCKPFLSLCFSLTFALRYRASCVQRRSCCAPSYAHNYPWRFVLSPNILFSYPDVRLTTGHTHIRDCRKPWTLLTL